MQQRKQRSPSEYQMPQPTERIAQEPSRITVAETWYRSRDSHESLGSDNPITASAFLPWEESLRTFSSQRLLQEVKPKKYYAC
jgi:hypothetical protein